MHPLIGCPLHFKFETADLFWRTKDFKFERNKPFEIEVTTE
jgi:hypothetical protein